MRPIYQNSASQEKINEIIRVDMAGEFGAKYIYQGQIDAAKPDEDMSIYQEMLDQEKKHLDYFTQEIQSRQIRPSIFLPIWRIGAYAMGFLSKKISNKHAMLLTEAVETVIVDHYTKQEELLKNDNKLNDQNTNQLLNKITEFKQEELEHKHIAISHDSQNAFLYKIFSKITFFICKKAISISKKY